MERTSFPKNLSQGKGRDKKWNVFNSSAPTDILKRAQNCLIFSCFLVALINRLPDGGLESGFSITETRKLVLEWETLLISVDLGSDAALLLLAVKVRNNSQLCALR